VRLAWRVHPTGALRGCRLNHARTLCHLSRLAWRPRRRATLRTELCALLWLWCSLLLKATRLVTARAPSPLLSAGSLCALLSARLLSTSLLPGTRPAAAGPL